ncbi:MAG: outer membrane lipoprotein carrier protein LolA [Acidobacteriaceae bacterium]
MRQRCRQSRASNQAEKITMANPSARLLLFAATLCAGLTLTGCGAGHVWAAQATVDRLKTALDQMTAASAKFHSAEANVQKLQFERIVNDTSTETGTIYFLRSGGTMQMGAKFDRPDAQVLEYKNGVGRIYNPATNQLQQLSASGANQARYDAYLTLGFGGSGTDLAKAWTITDQGTEPMSDGSKTVPVEKLDLVSKDASVRSNFTHITIWVDLARDVELKQVGYTPSGDTNTTIYTNIKLNTPIDLKAFEIKCKGKCG